MPDMSPARRRVVGSFSGRGICLATGLIAGVALTRTFGRSSQRTMPHLRTFQQALAMTHGEVTAAVLAARMQARYATLFATRPHFAHPALRWHLTYQILPGLALYQTLREDTAQRGGTPAAALAETGMVLERLEVLGRSLPLLRYVPSAFTVFRRITRLVTFLLDPAPGWNIQMEEDSPQRIAFTVSRCFYLDVLTVYGAPELTAHFCHLDDVAYAALPPGIRWERSTTLARGGTSCDFCWRAGSMEPAHVTREQDEDTLPTR